MPAMQLISSLGDVLRVFSTDEKKRELLRFGFSSSILQALYHSDLEYWKSLRILEREGAWLWTKGTLT